MPRKVTSRLVSHERNRRRYRILTDIGLGWRAATAGARSPLRFVAALRERGIDPDTIDPELTRVRLGGHPRKDTPEARAYKERYHALRKLGATAEEASRHGRGPLGYARAVKRLVAGMRP
jgi:hypothetical protein